MLSMGFLYIVLAVVYDLTIGDGIGNGVKSFALALLGLWVVMSLVWYTGLLDRLPGPPEERPPPRPDYSDALRYEPTVLGQVTPGRWQIIWKRASRRRLRRAFALLARVPVAIALGVLLVFGEEKALFEFLPDRPLFRVPNTAIALVLLLFGSGYLLLAAYRDLRRPATFVVGRVTRARPVKGKPGKTDSFLFVGGLKTDAISFCVRNSFTVSRIGKLVPATDPPAGPREVQVGEALLKRLQPGDLVVLVLAPDGRAVGRLIDL